MSRFKPRPSLNNGDGAKSEAKGSGHQAVPNSFLPTRATAASAPWENSRPPSKSKESLWITRGTT
eukprot:1542151-Alexandrium_andersonii.AAC.1